jgi:ribose transport system substrate-binding protein
MPRVRFARARTIVAGGLTLLVAAGATVAAAASSSGTPGVVPPKVCGKDLTYQNDPNGLLKTVPASTRSLYALYPYTVQKTPWSSFKGKKGPWKIGYVSFPTNNPFKVGLLAELQQQFKAAKAKGLVTGSLQTYIQPSFSTATPEQQDAAIQQMVNNGVDGILVHALNSTAEAPAFDAAGKAGVPVVLISDASPPSKYAINVFWNNNANARADLLGLLVKNGQIKSGKTTSLLMVRGVPGFTVEQAQYDSGVQDIKPCPGVKVVGSVWGQWNAAVQKTEVLKFLASHPEPVNLVFVDGGPAGVIEAFQQAGRPLPAMNYSGTSGGDLAWWSQNKSKITATGYQYSGASVAYTEFRLLLRILAGKEPRFRDISLVPAKVTSANVSQFATPGKSLTWIGDARMSPNAFASQLDQFFKTPGSPGGF